MANACEKLNGVHPFLGRDVCLSYELVQMSDKALEDGPHTAAIKHAGYILPSQYCQLDSRIRSHLDEFEQVRCNYFGPVRVLCVYPVQQKAECTCMNVAIQVNPLEEERCHLRQRRRGLVCQCQTCLQSRWCIQQAMGHGIYIIALSSSAKGKVCLVSYQSGFRYRFGTTTRSRVARGHDMVIWHFM